VDYPDGEPSPLDDVLACLAAGLDTASGGYWDGTGIRSSTAAAHPQKLAALGAVDDGDAVTVDYTWWGDADLDGVIDSNDYDKIDRAWGLWTAHGITPDEGFCWAVGDFNYDRIINSNDYDLIDRAWALSGDAALRDGTPAAMPEPATLALLAIGGLALLARRG